MSTLSAVSYRDVRGELPSTSTRITVSTVDEPFQSPRWATRLTVVHRCGERPFARYSGLRASADRAIVGHSGRAGAMAIDTSGKWWKGTEFADIAGYLRELQPGGYPVDDVIQAQCQCGSSRFTLDVDQDEELAQTTCTSCGHEAFVSDSGDHWSEASPRRLDCPSGHTEHELGLGRCIRDRAWVRWMSLGARCVSCGVLSSPLDWKSDLELTDPAASKIG
jgi:hypothetical protein